MESTKLQCSRCGQWEDSELMNTEDYIGRPTCMCNDCFEKEEEFNNQWNALIEKLGKMVADINTRQPTQ